MAFTGTFTVTQTSDLTSLTVNDTSSYSSEGQGTFSGRRIYLYKIDGTTLVPVGTTTSYIDFPFSDGASKLISGVLNTDYALLVNVVWLSNSPQPGSTYTAQDVKGFLNYLQQFYSGQISNLSDNPSILQDTNWYTDLSKLQTEIDNAEKSVSDDQQYSAQAAISRATYLMNHSQFFF
jgi:hypothetical protein